MVWERQLRNKRGPVSGHWTKVRVGGWGTWHWKPRSHSFLIMNEACRPSTIQWTQVRIKSSCIGFRDAIVYATQHQLIKEFLKFSTVWDYQLQLISQVILEAGMMGWTEFLTRLGFQELELIMGAGQGHCCESQVGQPSQRCKRSSQGWVKNLNQNEGSAMTIRKTEW